MEAERVYQEAILFFLKKKKANLPYPGTQKQASHSQYMVLALDGNSHKKGKEKQGKLVNKYPKMLRLKKQHI